MRIEIILSEKVPRHLREAVERCGFQVVRIGSAFRIRVGTMFLDPRGVTVRVEPGDPGPPGPEGPAEADRG
jgi:hypothetical protein